jgi:DNA-binding transcriptional MerR regulator
MKLGWASLLGLALCAWLLLRSALSQMWLEELQTRLGLLPQALIRLASYQIPGGERAEYAEEWLAELAFVLRGTDGLPVTRLLRGTHYAVGLLWVSRSIARELNVEQALPSAEQLPVIRAEAGYRGPTACAAAGITYRQLDYWARTGLVEPSVRPDGSSGTQRLYGFRDILALTVVKRLLDTGLSLGHVRAAIEVLRDRAVGDLAKVTLMSDGVNIYDITSPEEVYDLLQGGQGVFAIALGRIWQEVEDVLGEFPATTE